MRREEELRLRDMLIAARNIARFVENMTKQHFLDDVEKQYAVLHGVEIIGEAAHHISDETKEELDLLPWDDIRGMRNRIAHEYFAIDLDVVWDTLENDLVLMIQVLEECLPDAGDDDDGTGILIR